ncbi:MAG: hypothetical protein ACK5NK_06405 [Niabella sp.]
MNSKVQSILSYLGIVLWLIAFLLGKDERDDNSKFHLKQGFGLFVVSFVLYFLGYIIAMVVPPIGNIIVSIIGLGVLILIVIGIINAANEVKKPLPVIGNMFTNKFTFIDK